MAKKRNGLPVLKGNKLFDFAGAKKRGTSAHITKLNLRHKSKVEPSHIADYLREQAGKLKASSLKTLAFGLKKAYTDGLGDECNYDTKYKIDQALSEFTKKSRYIGDPVTKAAPIEQIKKLCERAGIRTGLIAEFLTATGIRVSEALNIKSSDMVKHEDHYVLYGIAKGGRPHTFKAPPGLVEDILSSFGGKKYFFETRGGKKYSRQEVYNMICKSSQYHLGHKITPHMLRHSWASYMVAKYPEDLSGIQKQGAWQSIETLYNVYVHNKLDVSKLPVLRDRSALRLVTQASIHDKQLRLSL